MKLPSHLQMYDWGLALYCKRVLLDPRPNTRMANSVLLTGEVDRDKSRVGLTAIISVIRVKLIRFVIAGPS